MSIFFFGSSVSCLSAAGQQIGKMSTNDSFNTYGIKWVGQKLFVCGNFFLAHCAAFWVQRSCISSRMDPHRSGFFGVTVYARQQHYVFMSGLALGSIFFGRLADRRKSPLIDVRFSRIRHWVLRPIFPAHILKAFRAPMWNQPILFSLGLCRFPGPLLSFFCRLIVPTFLWEERFPSSASTSRENWTT